MLALVIEGGPPSSLGGWLGGKSTAKSVPLQAAAGCLGVFVCRVQFMLSLRVWLGKMCFRNERVFVGLL